jgi:hypothetical protein
MWTLETARAEWLEVGLGHRGGVFRGLIQNSAHGLRSILIPRPRVNNGRGRQATLRQRLDAVAGPDLTAREYVGSQPASVY